jgi:hypothetical protein
MEEGDGFGLLRSRGELIVLIDRLMEDLLKETRSLKRVNSAFDCKDIPGISVLEYLRSNGDGK